MHGVPGRARGADPLAPPRPREARAERLASPSPSPLSGPLLDAMAPKRKEADVLARKGYYDEMTKTFEEVNESRSVVLKELQGPGG